MTPEELERQVNKNTIAIKTVSDSLTNYVQNQQLDLSNKLITANTSDIESLRDSLNSIQTQINLQNRIASMKDANIVDPAKLDLLQYDGDRWSNIAASKVVTGLLGKLTDLQDVEVSDLRNDNALAWDSEKQKWVNKNLNTELYDDIYISKIKPDSTPYEVWFKDSAIFGAEGFASGLTGFGGKIDKYGHAEFDSLTLRKFLEVPELRYNRVEIQVGDKWNAPGAGVIESVEQLDESTGTITLKLEDGEYGAVAVGDLCMGIFHSETTEQNADADSDDGRGTRQFAGFYTVYFEVTNVLDINNKRFGYKIRDIDDYWTLRYHPCAGMNFVAFGNKSNVDRQTSCYSTRTYTRYLIKQDTWDQKAVNIAMQFGDLSNLNVLGLEMEGYSAYLNSVYFTGTITQVKPSGQEVRYANDRGPWEPDTFYDYYDRVSVEGYLYLCVNVNGTTSKPSEDNPDWLMQVSKGDQGEGLILQRSEWEPNRIYRNESEVNAKVQPERYIDIVLVRNWGTSTGYKVYRCIFTGDEGQGQGKHLSSESNAPGSDGGAAYWEELAQNVGSIYTDVIIAKDAQIDFVTGNSLRVGYTSGNTFVIAGGITGSDGGNSDAVGLWLGDTENNRSNADFRVTFGGKMTANNADITGTITATSGTIGGFKIEGNYLKNLDSSGNGLTLSQSGIEFEGLTGRFSVSQITQTSRSASAFISSSDGRTACLYLSNTAQGLSYGRQALKAYGDIIVEGSVHPLSIQDVYLDTPEMIFYPHQNVKSMPNFVNLVKGYWNGTPGSPSTKWVNNYNTGIAVPNITTIRNIIETLSSISGSKGFVVTYINQQNSGYSFLIGREGNIQGATLGSDYPYIYNWDVNKVKRVGMDPGAVVTVLYTRVKLQGSDSNSLYDYNEYRAILLHSQVSG